MAGLLTESVILNQRMQNLSVAIEKWTLNTENYH